MIANETEILTTLLSALGIYIICVVILPILCAPFIMAISVTLTEKFGGKL